MAAKNLKLTPISSKQKPANTAERIIYSACHQGLTIEHIKRQTSHIREISMLLCEAQDRGDKDAAYINGIAQGAQNLLEVFADDIDESVDYFAELAESARAYIESRKQA